MYLNMLGIKDEGGNVWRNQGKEGRQSFITAVIALAITPNSRREYLSKVE